MYLPWPEPKRTHHQELRLKRLHGSGALIDAGRSAAWLARRRISVGQTVERVSHFLRLLGRGHCPQFGHDLQESNMCDDTEHNGKVA